MRSVLSVLLSILFAFGVTFITHSRNRSYLNTDNNAETYETESSEDDDPNLPIILRNREIMQEWNADFPHEYLTGDFLENGEVRIRGLKLRRALDMGGGYWDPEYYDVKDLVIPDEIEGHPVTSVGGLAWGMEGYRDAAWQSYGIKFDTIVIGNNVRVLESYAFYDTNVRSIVVGRNVEDLGQWVLEDCGYMENGKSYAADIYFYSKTLEKNTKFYMEEGVLYNCYHQIDEDSLLLDGEAAPETITTLPQGIGEDALLEMLSVDGEHSEIVIDGTRDDAVCTGTTVTLMHTAIHQPGKVYTVAFPGDTDGDGATTQQDLLMVRDLITGRADGDDNPAAYAAADLNGDGIVNSYDLFLFKMAAAENAA